MKSHTILSPAKINLNLKIGKIQKNGLHKINSQIHAIELFDKITINEKPQIGRTKITLKVTGTHKNGVPANSENIVYKAAKAFFAETKIKASIIIELEKNIPNKAGLGGASSNAAALLKCLEKVFNIEIDPQKMLAICHKLGSDVPFFYFGLPHALIEETGEKVKKLEGEFFYCCLCLIPKIQISTAWAYNEWDKIDTKNCQNTENDFEKVIFTNFPDLKDLHDLLMKNGAEKSGLSGSGSAIYAIFSDEEKLQKATELIKKSGFYFWSGKSLKENIF